jgi:hypothetical protein
MQRSAGNRKLDIARERDLRQARGLFAELGATGHVQRLTTELRD